MDKLNELESRAKRLLTPTTGEASETMLVEVESVLAAVEAFREMHQRAEAAEAKLAELAKQEPAGKFAFEPLAERYHHIKHGEAQHMEPKLPLVKLFTRAAPAAELAELVPDALDNWSNPASKAMKSINYTGSEQDFTVGANWRRSQILRRIEGLK